MITFRIVSYKNSIFLFKTSLQATCNFFNIRQIWNG